MTIPWLDGTEALCTSAESRCLRVQRKLGGKFHLRLNISKRPIANKYREGKMKRTLKRELKVLEIAEREAVALNTSSVKASGDLLGGGCQHQFRPGDIACKEVLTFMSRLTCVLCPGLD